MRGLRRSAVFAVMALGLPTALAVVAASPASAGPSDAGAASASASSTAMPWSSSPPGGLRRLWINGPPPTPSVSITKIPPDPPATRARAKWLFDLKYDRGDPYLLATRKIQLAAPEDAARVMGRFALELYEGPTLIERVRFDFPLLGAPEADAGYGAPPRIEPKLVTRVGVFFPALDRGTKLELWDRATGRRWALPWPPAQPPPPPPAGEVDANAP